MSTSPDLSPSRDTEAARAEFEARNIGSEQESTWTKADSDGGRDLPASAANNSDTPDLSEEDHRYLSKVLLGDAPAYHKPGKPQLPPGPRSNRLS